MRRKKLDSDLWFIDHIQPHQAKLLSWLKGKFPDFQDLDDVVQEAVFKVLRAHSSGPIINPKAYLFLTARNLVLSRIRRYRFEEPPPAQEIDLGEIMEEIDDPLEQIARKEEIQLLIDAIRSLPKRSRQVLTLRKVYGYSLKETASELGITVSAVASHSAIGIEKCEAFLRKNRIGENEK